MQIDKLFTAIWHDTMTWPWTPLTGLSATITIRDKSTNTVVVDNEAMTEIGLGEYDYTFTAMVSTKSYSYVMNPNTTSAYVVSWFVDPRMANMDWAITDIRGGGGFSINLSGVTGSISNLSKQITKQISELPQLDINEIKSHIDIAKDQVITTIESIEQAEFVQEEKEAKKAIKLLTTLDKKVSSYIDSEMKDKEELGAISKEFTKLEMEDAKREKEKEMEHKKRKEEEEKMEAEQDKKLLEAIKLEFEKVEEKEKEDKRKELEQELQEIEKEKKEIEQELKTL